MVCALSCAAKATPAQNIKTSESQSRFMGVPLFAYQFPKKAEVPDEIRSTGNDRLAMESVSAGLFATAGPIRTSFQELYLP
jgi:hypothetical protein